MCFLLLVSGGTERAGEQRGSPAPGAAADAGQHQHLDRERPEGVPKSDTVPAVRNSRKPA
jgi:hypothetical protein